MSNSKFSCMLKKFRKELKLSQAQVADLTFMSRRKLIDIENIYKKDLLNLFIELNKFYNIDIEKEIELII